MPLLWLSLAFLAGIIIADNTTFPAQTWLILAGLSFALAAGVFVLRRIRDRRTPAPVSLKTLAPLLLLCISFGALRCQAG